MSCHAASSGAAVPDGRAGPAGTLTAPMVVLVGNPNVGKSTLFNVVTGGRQQVVNAPGTTVELHRGAWRGLGGTEAELIDLPGTYSLLARSPDEHVTASTVQGAGEIRPDLAVVLVDATALSRSLYLLAQVAERAVPVVVALTMVDVARSRGAGVDAAALARTLGTPVVPVDPRRGLGTDALAEAVVDALATHTRDVDAARDTAEPADAPPTLADLALAAPEDPATTSLDDELAHADALFAWVDDVLRHVGPPPAPARPALTDRVDRVLLHPWAGIPVLLAVMWATFQLATSVAAPLMDGVDTLVNGWLADAVRAALPGPSWLEGLVVDGVLTGLGTVASFAPLMGLMFLAVAVLEDSGYLARVAFVTDRAMRALGLDGRAVLPLVVGFGCNVSALAAARTLPHARQRQMTALLVPYTSCAARLTVYILLAGAFFPDHAGTAIVAMYLASVLMVVGAGLVLRRTVFRDLRREPLVIALPAYQRPRVRALLASAWSRVLTFLTKAGRIIVVTLVVVWLAQAVPVRGGHGLADVPVEDSAYGWAAQAVTPVLEPTGFADWRASAALVTGFVAKEVVVGSLAQSYAVSEPDDPAEPGTLGERLRTTFERSSDGHGGAAAVAFMVFVLTYTPCLATVAEQAHLLGRRRTVVAVAVQLAVAWVLAVAVFQVGRLW